MGTERNMPDYYIHSKCCHVHWELHRKDGTLHLLCEKCGESSGLTIKSEIDIPGQQEGISYSCCMSNWELVVDGGKFKLLCEECGEDLEIKFETEPPEESHCAICNDITEIEMASQIGIDAYQDIADVFLREVFDTEGALITDESSLTDFLCLCDDRETAKKECLEKVEKLYGIDVSDVEGLLLLKIFERLRILSPRFQN